MNYYFCDACHFCFTAEFLPRRCPDCGKVTFGSHFAVREATDQEAAEHKKIQEELAASDAPYITTIHSKKGADYEKVYQFSHRTDLCESKF